ncbi:MAG: M48 family metallopeptidase [Hyphomonadaceae bacterium]|jgi:predicted metal-dependent hydrolase
MVAKLAQLSLPSGRSVEACFTGRRGAKRLTMRVDPIKRRLVVSGPLRVSQKQALGFVQENAAWIEARLDALPAPAPFVEGGEILFRGRPTQLVRVAGRGAPIFQDGVEPRLVIAATSARFSARVAVALKAFAQSDAVNYAGGFASRLGKEATSIALRDTRSRWGSCTSRGDIMLSWRLIGAPPKVFEYVVAHEMAHLLELNHSPAFWAHVTRLMPDWKPARAWLKSQGGQLQALGS